MSRVKKYTYNFDSWYEEARGLIFRIRVYRRVGDWTPYEEQHSDQIPSQYKDGDGFILCRIEKAIELPDGDILLGVRYLDGDTNEAVDFIEYLKLSNIDLVQVDDDRKAVNADAPKEC